MEWYFANEVEDLVVPKDYEQQDMISSTSSWSQWEINGFGSSNFPNKKFNSNIDMTREELAFNGGKNFYTSMDMSYSNNETPKSNNSSMTQELYNNSASLLWNDELDFQQFTEEEEEEEKARINHMDDIFFNSLFEENPTNDSTDTILGNDANDFEGEMVNSQNGGRHGQSIESSKYLNTRHFSPSTDWGNSEVSSTYQIEKQYTRNDNSMEESALNDLERVTAQFTDKTRICFRDAFYRLAKSSKQSLNSCQERDPMMTSDDVSLRLQKTEVGESETNVIDRAVGSLMFSKFDFEENDDQQVVSCYQHLTDYNDDTIVPQWDGACRINLLSQIYN